MNGNFDVPMTDAPEASSILSPHNAVNTWHFVVALDFGTTLSSVAYVRYNSPSQRYRIGLPQIDAVDRYPSSPFHGFRCEEVPSEIWYSGLERRRASPTTRIGNIHDGLDDSDSDDDDDDDDNSNHDVTMSRREPDHVQAPSRVTIPSSDTTGPVSAEWGFQVQDRLKKSDADATDPLRLRFIKLMLDDTRRTVDVRAKLARSCVLLTERGLIDTETSIIADYLNLLFCHVKKYLTDHEDYDDCSEIEFVLCVPAIWKAKSCRRMEVAMARAVEKSRFGKLQHGSVDNLFIVTEPEAAAMCVLADQRTSILPGQTFVLLDAGGGTVDAVTYTVHQQEPLRLQEEAVMAGGDLCGSSFINAEFEALVTRKLRSETYLNNDETTLSNITNRLVIQFETEFKREMDHMKMKKGDTYQISVPGLQPNADLHFTKNTMHLRRKEIAGLFRDCLEKVAKIMINQIGQAKVAGHDVTIVVLVGGFGRSERLKEYLKGKLADYNAEYKTNIKLTEQVSQGAASTVAKGAVLRALRKEDGPIRKLQCSFGFLRTERKGDHPEHREQLGKWHPLHGRYFIENTIEWVLKKGQTVANNFDFPIKVEYTFGLNEKSWQCKETLCVSDHVHESHYGCDHDNNIGAEYQNYIEFDVIALKPRIKPRKVDKAKIPSYKVDFDLVVIINGRNLRFEARRDGEVLAVGQTSLAAAFRPGTE